MPLTYSYDSGIPLDPDKVAAVFRTSYWHCKQHGLINRNRDRDYYRIMGPWCPNSARVQELLSIETKTAEQETELTKLMALDKVAANKNKNLDEPKRLLAEYEQLCKVAHSHIYHLNADVLSGKNRGELQRRYITRNKRTGWPIKPAKLQSLSFQLQNSKKNGGGGLTFEQLCLRSSTTSDLYIEIVNAKPRKPKKKIEKHGEGYRLLCHLHFGADHVYTFCY